MASVSQRLPSSSSLESDARLSTTGGHGAIAPGDIAIGVIIGRSSDAFNIFVFGIACVLAFPQVVFPFVGHLTGMLLAFAVFSLAFLARPVGSAFFMEVDRRFGRGTKLTIALVLLGGSTASIAFLPGYQQVGYISILGLILFRMGQGFALGGAWDGLASLLALNAPQNKRGFYAMIPQLGAPIGFMIASGLFAFFLLNSSQEDFIEWGWRYPFFVAFVINVVALFARLRLIATKEFAQLYDSQALVPVPVFAMLRDNWRVVVIGAFVPLSAYALYNLVTLYPISYVDLYSNRSMGGFLLIQCAGGIIQIATTVLSGSLADHLGRRNLIGVCAAGVILFSLVTPSLLSGGNSGQTVFVLVGFALLGLAYGQAAGAVASNFSGTSRYTGSALTGDLAWLLGAGFAPLVAIGGYEKFGLWAVCIYLLSGAICTLVALALNKRIGAIASHAAGEI